MRFSQKREIIKNLVRSTNTHPTADWVFHEAKQIVPNISLGTVYRNLKQLSGEGLIRKFYDNNVARYDWNIRPHSHLKCSSCGDLIDVKVSDKNFKKTIQKRFDFNVSDVEITFIGKCSKHN